MPMRRTCRTGSRRRTLVRMDRRRSFIEQFGGRGAVFGRPGLLLIVAAGRRGFGPVSADGLYITRELPDLLSRHLVAEGRHAVRPAVANRGKDRHHFRAVIPPAV